MATYKSAQAEEQAGHLLKAKDLLLSCSVSTCGAFLRQECTTRYSQLGNDIPSVVPLITDDTRKDVQVKMDNELLTSRLDGRAFPVDPGVHEFSFSIDGGVFATQRVMVVQGQRSRPIPVTMHPDNRAKQAAPITMPPPAETNVSPEPKPPMERPAYEKPAARKAAPEAAEPQPHPQAPMTKEHPKGSGPGPVPYIIGGVGLAAVGAGALFSIWGRKDNDSLSKCTPNCPLASVDHIKRLYTMANISIGAGVVALGVSALLFATSGSSSKEKAPVKSAYAIDVQPTNTGAYATVSGLF